jgi:hypothetical protein
MRMRGRRWAKLAGSLVPLISAIALFIIGAKRWEL